MDREQKFDFGNLPCCGIEFIKLIIKKMRYRRKVRQEVQAELIAHFEDALRDCHTDEEKQQTAEKIIADFGNPNILARLLRRGKKRCRPVWAKALVRAGQVIGIFILFLALRIGYLASGTATMSIDYAEWLNEKVRAGRDPNLNAMPLYEEAAGLLIEMPETINTIHTKWPGDVNELGREELAKWIAANEKAIEVIRKASQYPYYWRSYKRDAPDSPLSGTMGGLLDSLQIHKQFAYLLSRKSSNEAYSGDTEEALEDCLVMLKFARHHQARLLLVEQLVGVAIEALALGSAYEVLDRSAISKKTLRKFSIELNEILVPRNQVFDYELEKAFLYEKVQKSFTDDGSGNGRMLLKGIPFAGSDAKSILWNFLTMNLPDRLEIIEKIDEYFTLIDEQLQESPWQIRQTDTEANDKKQIRSGIALVDLMAPALGRINELSQRLLGDERGLVTVAAVLLYDKEKGKLPESLDDLVASGYMEQIPKDPYGGKPLIYKKTADGFTLYGVGLNFVDDGGKMGTKNGRPFKWAESGDTVHWPVARRTD
ncbi:MAG: hypothetical protein ABIG61_03535 [Planctomycetota bacterium]